MKYAKILVPLDGSSLAEQAVEASIPLAEAFGSEVLLLAVMDPNTGPYEGFQEGLDVAEIHNSIKMFLSASLDRAQARLEKSGVRSDKLLRVGIPHEEITLVASEQAIDLILMTTHGRKGFMHFLLGSVTERVLRTAPCPVMIVGPDIRAQDKPAPSTK